jgi:hypothetical protein
MHEIPLTRTTFALVDDEDFSYINQWKWFNHYGYARRSKYRGGGAKNRKYKVIHMHRLIMQCPEGLQVDHINGDTLDNRRNNLRIVTASDNAKNRGGSSNNTSGHTGVSYFKHCNRYMAYIGNKGKIINLGYYKDINEAISVRREAEKIYFGIFARRDGGLYPR